MFATPMGCAPKIPAWSHQSFSKEDDFAHCTDGCFLSMARRRQIHILVNHYHSHADPGAPPFQSSEHITLSSLDVEFRIRRQQLTNIRTCMLCYLNEVLCNWISHQVAHKSFLQKHPYFAVICSIWLFPANSGCVCVYFVQWLPRVAFILLPVVDRKHLLGMYTGFIRREDRRRLGDSGGGD